MSHTVPQQHPAVVLRSHYEQLRKLLAVALIAVAGLSGAVVILANDDNDVSNTTAAKSAQPANPVGSPRYFEGVQSGVSANVAPAPGVRFDGGPEEGTRGITSVQPPAARYDGGPEEGTRGITSAQPPVARYDGGPEEGTRNIVVPAVPDSRYDGGPEEGTRNIAPSPAQTGGADESPSAPGFSTD